MNGLVIKEAKGVLVGGDEKKEMSAKDGLFEENGVIPGDWKLVLNELPESEDEPKKYESNDEDIRISQIDYDTIRETGFACTGGGKQVVMINDRKGYSI